MILPAAHISYYLEMSDNQSNSSTKSNNNNVDDLSVIQEAMEDGGGAVSGFNAILGGGGGGGVGVEAASNIVFEKEESDESDKDKIDFVKIAEELNQNIIEDEMLQDNVADEVVEICEEKEMYGTGDCCTQDQSVLFDELFKQILGLPNNSSSSDSNESMLTMHPMMTSQLWTCFICPESYQTNRSDDFLHHIVGHATSCYRCLFCHKVFRTLNFFQRHFAFCLAPNSTDMIDEVLKMIERWVNMYFNISKHDLFRKSELFSPSQYCQVCRVVFSEPKPTTSEPTRRFFLSVPTSSSKPNPPKPSDFNFCFQSGPLNSLITVLNHICQHIGYFRYVCLICMSAQCEQMETIEDTEPLDLELFTSCCISFPHPLLIRQHLLQNHPNYSSYDLQRPIFRRFMYVAFLEQNFLFMHKKNSLLNDSLAKERDIYRKKDIESLLQQLELKKIEGPSTSAIQNISIFFRRKRYLTTPQMTAKKLIKKRNRIKTKLKYRKLKGALKKTTNKSKLNLYKNKLNSLMKKKKSKSDEKKGDQKSSKDNKKKEKKSTKDKKKKDQKSAKDKKKKAKKSTKDKKKDKKSTKDKKKMEQKVKKKIVLKLKFTKEGVKLASALSKHPGDVKQLEAGPIDDQQLVAGPSNVQQLLAEHSLPSKKRKMSRTDTENNKDRKKHKNKHRKVDKHSSTQSKDPSNVQQLQADSCDVQKLQTDPSNVEQLLAGPSSVQQFLEGTTLLSKKGKMPMTDAENNNKDKKKHKNKHQKVNKHSSTQSKDTSNVKQLLEGSSLPSKTKKMSLIDAKNSKKDKKKHKKSKNKHRKVDKHCSTLLEDSSNVQQLQNGPCDVQKLKTDPSNVQQLQAGPSEIEKLVADPCNVPQLQTDSSNVKQLLAGPSLPSKTNKISTADAENYKKDKKNHNKHRKVDKHRSTSSKDSSDVQQHVADHSLRSKTRKMSWAKTKNSEKKHNKHKNKHRKVDKHRSTPLKDSSDAQQLQAGPSDDPQHVADPSLPSKTSKMTRTDAENYEKDRKKPKNKHQKVDKNGSILSNDSNDVQQLQAGPCDDQQLQTDSSDVQQHVSDTSLPSITMKMPMTDAKNYNKDKKKHKNKHKKVDNHGPTESKDLSNVQSLGVDPSNVQTGSIVPSKTKKVSWADTENSKDKKKQKLRKVDKVSSNLSNDSSDSQQLQAGPSLLSKTKKVSCADTENSKDKKKHKHRKVDKDSSTLSNGYSDSQQLQADSSDVQLIQAGPSLPSKTKKVSWADTENSKGKKKHKHRKVDKDSSTLSKDSGDSQQLQADSIDVQLFQAGPSNVQKLQSGPTLPSKTKKFSKTDTDYHKKDKKKKKKKKYKKNNNEHSVNKDDEQSSDKLTTTIEKVPETDRQDRPMDQT